MTLTTEQLNDFAGVFRKDAASWFESGEPEIALELHALADELDALAANREAQPVEIGKRSVFTCSSCGAQGLDEPLESRCHCMGDGAHWVESALYTAPPAPATAVVNGRTAEGWMAEALLQKKIADDLRKSAPAVPEEMTGDGVLTMHDCGYIEGWNACRAAMLAGAPNGGNG